MSHRSPPDSLTVPLAPAAGPHGPAEVRLAGVENKEKMYEPKQRKKLVRVLTVVAYLFFVSLAAVMLSLYYVFLWNPSPRDERQRQQQQQHRYQQQSKQQLQLQQQQQLEALQQDDWSDDWSQGWSSTSMPDYEEATELLDGVVFAYSGQPPHSYRMQSPEDDPELDPEQEPEPRPEGEPSEAPARRHHHSSDMSHSARVTWEVLLSTMDKSPTIHSLYKASTGGM